MGGLGSLEISLAGYVKQGMAGLDAAIRSFCFRLGSERRVPIGERYMI